MQSSFFSSPFFLRPTISRPRRYSARKVYRLHREAARALVHERLSYFNQFYGFSYHRVSIRDQKTRWGSCSKRGNLNFNYRIALLPPYLADYIIVHELCHTSAFNHSKEFWSLVGKTIPEYKLYRKELKRIGMNTLK